MPWLTPPSIPTDTTCIKLIIPNSSDMRAAVFGLLIDLIYPQNWEVPPEGGATAEDTAQAFKDAYFAAWDTGDCSMCDCIDGLTYNPTTGKLTYLDANGNTIEVFNANDLSLTFNSYANLIPPPATDHAKYCYAAHQLYADWADSLGDILELVIANTNVTSSAIKGLISFPTLGLTPTEELVDFLQAITVAALTFANQNIADQDATALGAKTLYCAMLEAANAEDMENLWTYVDWISGLPDFAFSLNAWENFGEWAEWLYSQADGEFMAWFVLAYARFGLYTWGERLGLVEPIEKEVAAYANRAEAFDARDCSTFQCGDCFNSILDFTQSQACAYPRTVQSGCNPNTEWAEWIINEGWHSVALEDNPSACGRFNRIQLYVDLGETKTVTNVRYVWSIQTGGPQQELVLSAPAGNPTDFTTRYTGNNAAGEKSFSGSFSCRYLLFVFEQVVIDPNPLPAGEWTLSEVEITTS